MPLRKLSGWSYKPIFSTSPGPRVNRFCQSARFSGVLMDNAFVSGPPRGSWTARDFGAWSWAKIGGTSCASTINHEAACNVSRAGLRLGKVCFEARVARPAAFKVLSDISGALFLGSSRFGQHIFAARYKGKRPSSALLDNFCLRRWNEYWLQGP